MKIEVKKGNSIKTIDVSEFENELLKVFPQIHTKTEIKSFISKLEDDWILGFNGVHFRKIK